MHEAAALPSCYSSSTTTAITVSVGAGAVGKWEDKERNGCGMGGRYGVSEIFVCGE